MKLLFRAVTVLALVGLAAPAFPCGDKKMTTASTAEAKGKDTVAKGEKKAEAKTAKVTPQKDSKAAN